MRRYSSGVVAVQNRRVRAAGIAALSEVTQRSPVDTGFFRENWNAAVDRVDDEVTDRAEDPLDRGAAEIGKFRAELGHRFVGVANAVEYGPELENGSSAQAPDGMLRYGLAAAESAMKRFPTKVV